MTPQPDAPLAGRLLDGRYRLVRHIADGGMATVWAGVDERLHRDVAIKLLRPDLSRDATFAARFRREAQSAARLNDPHVVTVFDQGADGDDLFLVMELVPGRTLREVIHAEAPLSPRAALDLMIPVARALGVAHQAGIVHRDIKPENVIIRPDGRVKVADFGLARAVTAATVTGTGAAMLGTISYLSPEQVERGIADARSDVYAAGLLLFELLTGRKGFDGDSPIHVAYQHVHGDLVAPSAVVRSVPAALDAVVAWATDRDPDQRPIDGDALADRLAAVRASLDTTVLDARPTGAQAGVAAAAPTVVLAAGPAPVGSTTATRRLPTVPPQQPGSTHPAGGRTTRPQPAAIPPSPPRAATAPPTTPPRRRRSPWGWLVSLVLAAALAGAGGWWFTSGPGGSTTVPRVATQSASSAETTLRAARLEPTIVQEFSESIAKDAVIRTTPAAGAELGNGSQVSVVVSKGPERYAVPSLLGKTRQEATDLLTAAHLALGKVTRDWSETVPAGQVITATPGPGESLKPKTEVALVLSKGREPIDVPTLTGKTMDEAKALLDPLGLSIAVGGEPQFSSQVPADGIVSQQPSSGTVHRGDAITVVLSKGPELVQVPDLFGKSRDDAERLLKEAGFVPKVDLVFTSILGLVNGQDPAAGSMAPKGSTVTIRVV